MGSSAIISSWVPLVLLLARLSTGTSFSGEDADTLPAAPVTYPESPLALDQEAENVLLDCVYDNMASALLQAQITMEKINEFKDKYARDKFNMSWRNCSVIIPWEWDETILEVCSVEQECSAVLPSLVSLSTTPPVTDAEAAQSLTQMTGHFLRFMYAYEQMVLDQALNEDNFTREMYDAYTDHNHLASLLEEVQDECGVPRNISSSLTSLHGKMHVTTSIDKTHIRGFSTLRHSLQGLNLLLDMFWEGSSAMRMTEDIGEEDRRDRRRRRRNGRFADARGKRNDKTRKTNRRRRRRRRRTDDAQEDE